MLLSIIIPTYNEEKYISRCLASLQQQELDTHDKQEIIIVDDGSRDKTVNKIKRFKGVKLLHQSHQGPANSRNLGAKYASGEILIFVDADMDFERDFIRKLTRPIKYGHVKGTFSKEEFVANWQNPIARSWNWNQDLPPKRRLPLDHPDEGTDFRAILASEFKKVIGFDDTGYTDTWSLSKKLGYKPRHAPGAKFNHYNPATLSETFSHAQWVGKRRYKAGFIGSLVAFARASFPISLLVGSYKMIKYREPIFPIFKLIYDLGLTVGILQLTFTGKTAK